MQDVGFSPVPNSQLSTRPAQRSEKINLKMHNKGMNRKNSQVLGTGISLFNSSTNTDALEKKESQT
jgi:hypothetical protein